MADVELVIKIPEDEYRWIIKSDETVFADVASKECMLNAIKNGTPLPKGHGRLIDSDALDIDNLNRAHGDNFELDFGRLYTTDVVDMIANAPTLIEADKENKHADSD